MAFPLLVMLLCGALAIPPTAAQAASALDASGVWSQLRDSDLRLATVLYRLAVTNTGLCSDIAPATGMVLISGGEFPERLRTDFHAFYPEVAPMAVEAVVPGGPAEQGGVRPGSGLVAIDGSILPDHRTDKRESTALQAAATRAIEQAAPNQPIVLDLRESGAAIRRTIEPTPACRATAELLTDNNLTAQSDDNSIQISATFLLQFSSNALPPVMAHELAHIILHHTQTLTAQHVDRGLLSVFGRNATLIRATEDDADRLSVHLLANAGYDPELAVQFWQTEGRQVDAGIFRGPTHGSPAARARMMQAEITEMACHVGGCDHGNGAFGPAAPLSAR